MPSGWNDLEDPHCREVTTLLGSFYDKSCGDCNKEPWSIPNLKKYLNLGYLKLDDLPKFRAAYFATVGDYLVFVEPTPENNTLLDEHDGFSLKLKKLVKNYQDNRTEPKTQQMMFLHMTNNVTTEHFVTAKNKNGRFVDLEPSSGFDVAITEFQKSVLNPTKQDVVISDIISQSQRYMAKKKEAKQMRYFFTQNVNSYSRILNDEKSLKIPRLQ